MWDETLALVKTRATVRTPILPGHGFAPALPGGFADALDLLASELDPDPAVVVGYSLGGRLALGLAIRHAPRVAAALVIGAHPGLEEAEERAARQRWEADQAAHLGREGVAAFMEAWEAQPIFATQSAEQREAQRPMRFGHTAAGLAWAMEALGLGRMPSWWMDLMGIARPLVFMTGALDAKFTELGARAARMSRRIRTQVVPSAGHNVALERPAAVARALDALLTPPASR
jgi:2-succinyl-6-hydroxy-2,4-cyclohexadiene-1-carboxylate synthase